MREGEWGVQWGLRATQWWGCPRTCNYVKVWVWQHETGKLDSCMWGLDTHLFLHHLCQVKSSHLKKYVQEKARWTRGPNPNRKASCNWSPLAKGKSVLSSVCHCVYLSHSSARPMPRCSWPTHTELNALFVDFFFLVLVCSDIFCLIGLFPICFCLGGFLFWFCFLFLFLRGEQRK